jgi:hypothetical protein
MSRACSVRNLRCGEEVQARSFSHHKLLSIKTDIQHNAAILIRDHVLEGAVA